MLSAAGPLNELSGGSACPVITYSPTAVQRYSVQPGWIDLGSPRPGYGHGLAHFPPNTSTSFPAPNQNTSPIYFDEAFSCFSLSLGAVVFPAWTEACVPLLGVSQFSIPHIKSVSVWLLFELFVLLSVRLAVRRAACA